MSANTTLTTVSGLPWKGVEYFCTTRLGGVSTGPWSGLNLGLHTDDDAADVATNRKRLRALAPSEPLWLKQVHGTDVFDADEPGLVDGMPTPVADAAVTASAGKVLALLTADCLPVVLARSEGCLGVAPAGWPRPVRGGAATPLSGMRTRGA